MTAVEAFLRDPDHLASDDGSVHGAATNRPELYQLAALRRRLLPVLAQLGPDDFELLARDRNLMILASPTPRVRPQVLPATRSTPSHTARTRSPGTTCGTRRRSL